MGDWWIPVLVALLVAQYLSVLLGPFDAREIRRQGLIRWVLAVIVGRNSRSRDRVPLGHGDRLGQHHAFVLLVVDQPWPAVRAGLAGGRQGRGRSGDVAGRSQAVHRSMAT